MAGLSAECHLFRISGCWGMFNCIISVQAAMFSHRSGSWRLGTSGDTVVFPSYSRQWMAHSGDWIEKTSYLPCQLIEPKPLHRLKPWRRLALSNRSVFQEKPSSRHSKKNDYRVIWDAIERWSSTEGKIFLPFPVEMVKFVFTSLFRGDPLSKCLWNRSIALNKIKRINCVMVPIAGTDA